MSDKTDLSSIGNRESRENSYSYNDPRLEEHYWNQDPNQRPTESIDMAHYHLTPSKLSEFFPQLDKEIKLANLDNREKFMIWAFQSVHDDMIFYTQQQEKKIAEIKSQLQNSNRSNILNEMKKDHNQYSQNKESGVPSIVDALDTLIKSIRVAVISRGKYGFERNKQVETINKYQEETSATEQPPSWMNRMFGGFKR